MKKSRKEIFFSDRETLYDFKSFLTKQYEELQKDERSLQCKIDDLEILCSALREEVEKYTALRDKFEESGLGRNPSFRQEQNISLINNKLSKVNEQMDAALRNLKQMRKEKEYRLNATILELDEIPISFRQTVSEAQSEIAMLVEEKRKLKVGTNILLPSTSITSAPSCLKNIQDEYNYVKKDRKKWKKKLDSELQKILNYQGHYETIRAKLQKYKESKILLKFVFEIYDVDCKGYLQLDEAVLALLDLIPRGKHVTEKMVRHYLEHTYSDQDGLIHYDEFSDSFIHIIGDKKGNSTVTLKECN